MAPVRRDFSRRALDSGDDFTSTVMTTVAAVVVLGYIINRIFRRGATAAANAGNTPQAAGATGGAALPAAAGGKPSTGTVANDPNVSIEERMATLAFAGWKVAVDVDAVLSRSKGTSDTDPQLRALDGSSAYFKSILAAKADCYVYCQVDRDSTKKPAGANPYVGEVSSEFVGQQEILNVLKPFAADGLRREQVLFCATSKGHESFSRQLQPTILITTRANVAELLARHVPYIVYVSGSSGVELSKKFANVISVESLGRFHS